MPARAIALIVTLFVLIGIGYTQSTAQTSVTCPDLVTQALSAVGDNCGGLERNSACYGFNNVQANFTKAQPLGFFTRPRDRARLIDLENITTGRMDRAQNQWGVALMSVQANLPDTLPGQSVVFMLLGDTQVENAVEPEQAFQTGTTASVTLPIGANLYFKPDLGETVVATVPMGTALTADAISADGQWVRVVYAGIPGWLTQQVVSSASDLSTLPVIGATPLQSFYFRTSISGTECTEAPNSLIIQGPRNQTIDLNVNGADMRISSTIALYTIPGDPTMQQYVNQQYGDVGAISAYMQVLVLDGHVVLDPDSPNAESITTGETTFRCLDEPENRGLDGQTNDREVLPICPWAPARPVAVADVEEFRSLEGTTLNYPIDLPLDLPTLTLTPTMTNTLPTGGGGVFVPTATATLILPTDTPLPTTAPGQPTNPPADTPLPTDTPVPGTSTPIPPTPTDTPVPPCDSYTFPYTVLPGDANDFIAAIDAANSPCHPGDDVMALASGSTYTFTGMDNDTDGPNALPVITENLRIYGQNATVEAAPGAGVRLFYVASGVGFTFTDFTMRGGDATGHLGGALYTNGSFTLLQNATFSGNTANDGGAIFNNAGAFLSIDHVTFDGNHADLHGGALKLFGDANIDHTTFSNNSAAGGGAIYNEGVTLYLGNSTVSGNSAGSGGAGIFNNAGSVVFNFVTVFGNSGSSGVESGGSGGSDIFANDTIVGGSSPNCSITDLQVFGANFADDGSCTDGSDSFTLVSGGLNLGPLASNGGTTQTHALHAPSQALDSNDCTDSFGATIGSDQRGNIRPQDNDGSPSSTECDAGAYESATGE